MSRLLFRMIAIGCISTLLTDAQTIRLHGSDTLGAKMVPQLSERYKATHPGIVFEITAEGSTQGFKDLLEGTAGIGMSTRATNEEEARQFEEKGNVLSRWAAASDLIAIGVNRTNPVNELTSKQVEAIFAGDVTDWSEVGGGSGAITLCVRNSASASTRNFVVSFFMDGPMARG